MKSTALSSGAITPWIIVTGAGMGLILGPASTDATNRAINASYGEVTGVVMTLRTYGAAVGLAVLGTLMINTVTSKLVSSLTQAGVPLTQANKIASAASSGGGAPSGHSGSNIPAAMQQKITSIFENDFASAIQVVLYGMAVVMAICLVISFFHPGGKAQGSMPGGGA